MAGENLFTTTGDDAGSELFQELLRGREFRLERIVSTGQSTPAGQWYDQTVHEWVVLLSGRATLRFEDDEATLELLPGDYVNIPAHRRHRVEYTDPNCETVWLALHYS